MYYSRIALMYLVFTLQKVTHNPQREMYHQEHQDSTLESE